MAQISCPNCGDRITPHPGVRMLTCPSCGTTLFHEDEAVRLAGEAGVMHDAPLLFGLGDRVRCAAGVFDVLGHARFSYGRGWWDEFWALDADGHPVWLSIDEGDVAVQRVIPEGRAPAIPKAPILGRTFSYDGMHFRVTEFDEATCLAIRGEFDEALKVGETYNFVNALSVEGVLLSGEFWPGGHSWFTGEWIDPFEVTVERIG
jgi:predicted RNA-binding Zn-ribbon protein involved in translation (DUF1610 family)